MFHLLPDGYKKKLLSEYHMRVLVIFLSFLFAAAACALVFLVLVYFTTDKSTGMIATKPVVEATSTNAFSSADAQAMISDTSQKIALLRPEKAPYQVDELIKKAATFKITDVVLRGFSYSASEDGTKSLIISGNAKSRDALSLFVKNLRADKTFGNLDFPVSNFAKEADIDFSITIHLP